jgi:N utilization substance protein B
MTSQPEVRGKNRSYHRGIRRQNAARLAAIQALYQIELTGSAAASVVDEFQKYRIDRTETGMASKTKANFSLFSEIVKEVERNKSDIDQNLGGFIDSHRPIGKLEIVMRCVLRAGFYELKHRLGSPSRSIITEYVHISDAFFSDQEPSFVNGVLDRAARVLRPAEFASSTSHDKQ